jgi:hypothetical protein
VKKDVLLLRRCERHVKVRPPVRLLHCDERRKGTLALVQVRFEPLQVRVIQRRRHGICTPCSANMVEKPSARIDTRLALSAHSQHPRQVAAGEPPIRLASQRADMSDGKAIVRRIIVSIARPGSEDQLIVRTGLEIVRKV